MSIRRLRFNSVDPVSVIRLAILAIFCFGFITNADAVALQDDGGKSGAQTEKNVEEESQLPKLVIKPDKQVVFKKTPQAKLKLKIFLPKTAQENRASPAIVFFFGGGWAGGTPKQFFQQSKYFAEQGMVAIAADYRVRSRHKTSPLDAVEDGKSAIRWIRSHAKELGIDPQRIVAAGGSAGGHIAACTDMVVGLDEDTEDKSISSRPNALILFNPVLDTTTIEKRFENEEQAKTISPIHHVRSGLALTLIFHGTKDKAVPFELAEKFDALMKESGNSCVLKTYKGRDHGFFNSRFFRPKLKDTSNYERVVQECHEFLASLGYIDQKAKAKELKKTEEG